MLSAAFSDESWTKSTSFDTAAHIARDMAFRRGGGEATRRWSTRCQLCSATDTSAIVSAQNVSHQPLGTASVISRIELE